MSDALLVYQLTPDQYSSLLAKMQMDKTDIQSLQVHADGTGSIETKDILLTFAYVTPNLNIYVEKVKSFLARHVSTDTLVAHIKALLETYV